jgi:hypothetical protein
MSPEDILMEEMNKWGEYIDEISEDQTSAFLIGIIAHRCSAAESMVNYLKKRLERYEKKENGQKVREILEENG